MAVVIVGVIPIQVVIGTVAGADIVLISSGFRLIVILLPAPEYNTEYIAEPFDTVLIAWLLITFGLVITVIVSFLSVDDAADTANTRLAVDIIGAWLTFRTNVGFSIVGVTILADEIAAVAIEIRVAFVVLVGVC